MILEEREQQLLKIITTIQRDYQTAIKPYIEQLARIRGMRPTKVKIAETHQILQYLATLPEPPHREG